MSLIVQRFGGTSVANTERMFNVADIVTRTYDAGNDVVVVVSAQGDTTDDLIEKANAINPNASKREMDMLLTSRRADFHSFLLGHGNRKAGISGGFSVGLAGRLPDTARTYRSTARIKQVEADRIQKELDKKNIVVVTGFQGTNRYDDMTTLGRGGSDTSAVAIAAVLCMQTCARSTQT